MLQLELGRFYLMSQRDTTSMWTGSDDEDEKDSDVDDDTTSEEEEKQESDDDKSSDEDVDNPAAQRASQEAAKYRVERNDLRKQLADAQAKLKEIDDADKSELALALEKVAKAEEELADLRSANRSTLAELAVLRSEEASKFRNPSDILKFVSGDDLVDDEGEPLGSKEVAKLLKGLLSERPYLAADEGDKLPAKPKNKRSGDDTDPSDKQLQEKYPALRRRQRSSSVG